MTLSDLLLLMRHEWLLLLAVVIILLAELGATKNRAQLLPGLTITVTGIITLTGFIPAEEGSLFGGMYVTDSLRVLMKNILQVGVWLIFLLSDMWVRKAEMHNRIFEFYLLILASLLGACYLISAGHFLMFYLGLELLTLPVAAIAAFEYHRHRSAEAGIKLVLSSAFASAVLLYGISMLYATSASLYFNEFTYQPSALSTLGLIFLISGVAFKISVVPFHLWTADVYEGSPTANTAYLSVISKAASVFALLLLCLSVLRPAGKLLIDALAVLAALTITVGNLFALRQQNIKRFLAFSSVAQAGFILLGVIQNGPLGATTVLYFVFIYMFSNLAAFGVVMLTEQLTGKVSLNDYNGFYITNPKLSLVMMLALFSLAGIPPLAGFFGKFFLFAAAAERGYYLLVGIAVLNAVISLYYYLLVIKAMFIHQNTSPVPTLTSPFSMKLALLVCMGGILLIGFFGDIYEYMADVVNHWWYELAKI